MKISMPKGQKKIKNKLAFDYYCQFGSTIAARVYTQETGVEITPSGIDYAKNMWIVRHPQEAKKILVPDKIPEVEWKLFLVRRAIFVYGRAPAMGSVRAFHKFIADNNLQYYSWAYADRFGENEKSFKRFRNK